MTDSSRRNFLKTGAALALSGGSLLSRFAQAQDRAAATLPHSDSSTYWASIRAGFAFPEDAVPMNAANLCPSFRAVSEERAWLTGDIDRDCSFPNRARFGPLLEHTRERIAGQLGVDADEIALVRNTSEANNIINAGLPLESGDEVLLWDQNHPTNNVAWDVRAARYGFRVRRVTTPAAPVDSAALLDAFVSRMGSDTRVLALTHVSNVSGVRLPVAELVEAAHARNIFVLVDGAQTWGAMDLDLRALGVDAYTASAHKWYMGPREVGLLYVRGSQLERIWPSVVAPGWGDSAETSLEGARKLESFGQRDDAALAALGLAASMHDHIGPARIEARTIELSQRLKTGMQEVGLELVTPMDPALSFGVCIARAPAGQAGRIMSDLYTDHGIAGAATGGIRLCPAIYNTETHVDRAVEALRRLTA